MSRGVFLGGVFLSVVLFIYPADAFVNFDLEIANVEGTNWAGHGARIALKQVEPGTQELNVWVKYMHLPEQFGVMRNVNVHCSYAKISSNLVQCPRGRVHVDHSQFGTIHFSVDFTYEISGKGKIEFSKLTLMGGHLAGQVRWWDDRWLVDLEGEDIDVKRMYKFLRHSSATVSNARFHNSNIELKGAVKFYATIAGNGKDLDALAFRGKTNSFGFSNMSSTQVGEELVAETKLVANKVRGGWQVELDMGLNQGQLYVDPVFLEPSGNQAVWLSASAVWWEDDSVLQLNKLDFLHPGVVQASAQGTFNLEPIIQIETLRVDVSSARAPDVYTTYVQPTLIGTMLDDLMTAGEVSGGLEYCRGGHISVNLHIKDFSMDDTHGRFGIYGVNGILNWQNNGIPSLSRLQFEGGRFYKIEFGSAQLGLSSRNRDIDLISPVSMPVFDGQLNVESFSLRDAGADTLSWTLDAGLSPVSMETFTGAVGWPLMSGKLSGMIPAVSYRSGNLQVGGALLVRVFDGHVTINNLQLLDPFGLVPQLNADIELSLLDLNALTRTFSFGKMEGRVSGYVRQLELVNWQPVHFNASIGTPENGRSRRRISQRAVDNLTSLGGGMSGVLSNGFLSLFDEFYYDRVGLSCRLKAGICEMDGIAPTDGEGYYIVTGAWLPRIDIIGYNHRVDWNELVARLKRVSLEAQPVIQ